MSYFKQIASRARPTSPGRSQSLPLLNPTQSLFRPVAVVQPLELPDERLGSDESERVGYSQASTTSSATESISSSTTATAPTDSNFVHSPAQLPATPLTITPSQVIPPLADLSLPLREPNLPDSRSANPARRSPVQDRAERQNNPGFVERSLPTPLPASPSPLPSLQMPAASSSTPNLHRDSPQHLVPIEPTKLSGLNRQPSGNLPIPLVDQASVKSTSASNLTTETALPLRAKLEPKHSTQVLPTERMAGSPSQLPPPSFPGTSKPDRSQRSTIHIGAIDIQITPSPVTPQPLTTRSVATPTTGSLSRGFTSGFGLRQG